MDVTLIFVIFGILIVALAIGVGKYTNELETKKTQEERLH